VDQTPLGRDGPLASRIGLGLAALGRPAYLDLGHGDDLGGDTSVEALQTRAHAVLDVAHERGITYVDAARSYGRAEEFLATWLRARELDPGTVTVGSKWGYRYVGGWRLDATTHEVKDHSVDALKGQWEESRRLLGRHLALYQVHSATFDTGVLRDQAVLDELARLRAGEEVAIGLSISGPEQRDLVRAAMEVQYEGEFLFTSVQATWNPLEPSAEEALAEAHHEGIGVIVKEAAANGRLAGRDPAVQDTTFWGIVEDLDAPPDVVALAAALSRPWATVVLSGATTEAQLTSNLEALEVEWNPAWDERLRIPADVLASTRAAYWKRRADLPWT
jgi:aryl-alcohol dehydrogenase-like predicted oxidoreductase